MEKTVFNISGMSCGHCVKAVREELAKLPGVHVEDVQIGMARILYDPKLVDERVIETAIREAGYTVVHS